MMWCVLGYWCCGFGVCVVYVCCVCAYVCMCVCGVCVYVGCVGVWGGVRVSVDECVCVCVCGVGVRGWG